MHFAETDAKASEDDLSIQATIWVKGAPDLLGHNFTLTATPLTVSQYMAEPGKYRNSCHSVIDTDTDTAEGALILYNLYY